MFVEKLRVALQTYRVSKVVLFKSLGWLKGENPCTPWKKTTGSMIYDIYSNLHMNFSVGVSVLYQVECISHVQFIERKKVTNFRQALKNNKQKKYRKREGQSKS